MDTIIVFCVLVFSAAIFSKISKAISYVIRQARYRRESVELAFYEDRFDRLAQEAGQGPILIEDMRVA